MTTTQSQFRDQHPHYVPTLSPAQAQAKRHRLTLVTANEQRRLAELADLGLTVEQRDHDTLARQLASLEALGGPVDLD